MQNVNGSVFVTVMNRVTRRAFPIKGDKTIKYMVKNAKARKNLKKVKKMRKKHDVCACVGVRVADNKISGSEQ